MRVLLQRVSRAAVRVEGETIAAIRHGLLLLVGFRQGDGQADLDWMADKLVHLRIFEDSAGKMNLALAEVGGEALAVSQFTLYADARKGRRPSFDAAAPAEEARQLFERFVDALRRHAVPVQAGRFQAAMQVELVNDGPVTIMLDSPAAAAAAAEGDRTP
ncbi:MAG: D-aminoacyl-tRNA deacylase [Candidatus Methylomirabilota bacterium]